MSTTTSVRPDAQRPAAAQPLLDVKDLVVRYGRGRKAAAAPRTSTNPTVEGRVSLASRHSRSPIDKSDALVGCP